MNAATALSVLLDLRRHQPDEVVAVRVCGLERRGLLERRQRRLRVARALLQQAQVVPGPRVLRLARRRLDEQFPRRVVALQADERDGLVHARHRQRGICRHGLLEPLQALLELLLVHARDAQVVQANRFAGCRGLRRTRGRLGRAEDEDGGEDQKRRENGTSHRTQSIAARGSSPRRPVGKRCCVAMPSPTPDRVGRYTGRYAAAGQIGGSLSPRRLRIATLLRSGSGIRKTRGAGLQRLLRAALKGCPTRTLSVSRRRGPRPGARSPKPVTRHPRRACRARGLRTLVLVDRLTLVVVVRVLQPVRPGDRLRRLVGFQPQVPLLVLLRPLRLPRPL